MKCDYIMKDIHFNDIDNLVNYCLEHYKGNNYVFRGQSQTWPLCSSLFRKPKSEIEKDWKKTVDFITWMLNDPFLQPFHEPQEKLIAIAQHYGFATDLIDFTRDPRIAAFFAVDGDIDFNKKGIVYVINLQSLELLFKIREVPSIVQYEIDGLWRLECQQGLFLRDYHGIISQLVEFGESELFLSSLTFDHNEGKKSIFYIDKEKIYPGPNDFEKELETYKQYLLQLEEERITNELISSGNCAVVTHKDIKTNINTQFLDSGDWYENDIREWETINQQKYEPHKQLDAEIGLIFTISSSMPYSNTSPLGLNNEQLVKKYLEIRKSHIEPNIEFNIEDQLLERINNIKTIKISSSFEYEESKEVLGNGLTSGVLGFQKYFLHILKKRINEYLSICTSLPYSITEIATGLQALFSMLYCRVVNELPSNSQRKIMNLLYNEDIMHIEYINRSMVASDAWVPEGFFDSCIKMGMIKDLYNGKHVSNKLPRNCNVLMFFHNFRELLTFEEAKLFWSSIILPYQILFNREKEIIQNPYYIERIGYM